MTRYALLIPIMLLAGLMITACQEDDDLPVMQEDIPFTTEGSLQFQHADGSEIVSIDIELAETEEEQRQGLMHRRSLPSRSGMLFLYDDEDERSFWMRNTPMPLDIIFVDGDGWVVNVAERTTPYSDENITSGVPAQYAVEVRAGFAERHGIVADSVRMDWQRH